MKNNLLSISQLTSSGNYVVLGQRNVKVYRNLKPTGVPIMEGRKLESVYVLSPESKERNDGSMARKLGHVSYNKLKIMMEKFMLKKLPLWKIRRDMCQLSPYKESKFRAKKIHYRQKVSDYESCTSFGRAASSRPVKINFDPTTSEEAPNNRAFFLILIKKKPKAPVKALKSL